MRFFTFLLLGMLLIMPSLSNGQVFIDSLYEYPAEVYAYQVGEAPVIDGDFSEWDAVPWSGVPYYNDRDFNGDEVLDPLPERTDFMGKFKAVWVDGSNILYLMLERHDDHILSDDETSWYHVDGSEFRIDPYNEDAAGEPGDGNAFNIGFRVGKDEHTGIEGPLPAYEAKWSVNEDVYPTVARLEVAITLPEAAILELDYPVGFHIYFSDTENDDDSPGSKNNCLQFWGQLYNAALQARLGVDATWGNVHSWGDLVCVEMPTVHTVSGGGFGAIQATVDAAAAGDIIEIGPGEYYENLVIDKPRLQLVSTADMSMGDTTKIMPDLVDQPALTVVADNMTRNVMIKGILFDGEWYDEENDTTMWAQQGVEINAPEVKFLNNVMRNFESTVDFYADYGVAEDNVVYNTNGAGIDMQGTGTSLVRYNRIDRVFGGYGVDHKGLSDGEMADIAFNTISDIRQCGIGWGGPGGTFYIHHNYIYRSFNQRTTGEREMDDGIENQEGDASLNWIYNNTIVGWNSDGMQLNGPSTFHVRNNIVAELRENRDYDLRNTETITYDIGYGLSWNSNGDAMRINTEFDPTNSWNTDPMFTDALADDYTLMASSPAKDKGEYEPFGLKTHYAIPEGGWVEGSEECRPDIGAYEIGYVMTSIDNNDANVVKRFDLAQNYPNPFNPVTTIRFNLAKAGPVTLKIYDVVGREVATLVNGKRIAGENLVEWNASEYSSGIYFYSLKADGKIQTKKMVLVK